MKRHNNHKDSVHATAFHGGGFWNRLDYNPRRVGDLGISIIPADVLDAWYPPSPKVVKTLQENLEKMIHTCPPAQPIGLMRALSKARGIPENNILCGTGSSQLIFLLLQNLLQKNDTVMILDPMYGEYRFLAENVINAKVITYQLHSEHEFTVSIPEMASAITKHRPKLIILVNPNSPTGTSLSKDQVGELLSTIPPSTKLILDETYIEYVGNEESCEKLVQTNTRLCVLKSMSKVYALSGLRVGYLVASQHMIKEIAPFVPPWSVSLLAQIGGITALGETEYYEARLTETKELKEGLFQDLKKIPHIKPFPSVANFVLCRLKDYSASRLKKQLADKNVYVRNCDSMSEQFNDNFIRITVMDKEANEKIINALHQTLS